MPHPLPATFCSQSSALGKHGNRCDNSWQTELKSEPCISIANNSRALLFKNKLHLKNGCILACWWSTGFSNWDIPRSSSCVKTKTFVTVQRLPKNKNLTVQCDFKTSTMIIVFFPQCSFVHILLWYSCTVIPQVCIKLVSFFL